MVSVQHVAVTTGEHVTSVVVVMVLLSRVTTISVDIMLRWISLSVVIKIPLLSFALTNDVI